MYVSGGCLYSQFFWDKKQIRKIWQQNVKSKKEGCDISAAYTYYITTLMLMLLLRFILQRERGVKKTVMQVVSYNNNKKYVCIRAQKVYMGMCSIIFYGKQAKKTDDTMCW